MKSGRKAVWVALCLLVVSVVLLAVFLFVESRGKAGVLHSVGTFRGWADHGSAPCG
ncbi:hypothetical protein [Amedibacillus dolichus]|nr:hypothetical protein [Amedibacillus dolichus]